MKRSNCWTREPVFGLMFVWGSFFFLFLNVLISLKVVKVLVAHGELAADTSHLWVFWRSGFWGFFGYFQNWASSHNPPCHALDFWFRCLLFYFVLAAWIVFVAWRFDYLGLLDRCSALIRARFLHASVPRLGPFFVNVTLTQPLPITTCGPLSTWWKVTTLRLWNTPECLAALWPRNGAWH